MQPEDIPPRADHALMGAVLQALADPALGLAEVQVEYIEETVVLRGRAASETLRIRAGEAACRVPGVAGVSNRLRVG